MEIFGMIDLSVNHKSSIIRPKLSNLNYLGDLSLIDGKIIGIVGPRKLDNYAKTVLDELFLRLRNYNVITISGLADGVDKYVFESSLKNSIKHIAVLGNGIGYGLAGKDRSLIKLIYENGGLILSEYDDKFSPTNYSYPLRNRIIAGFSDLLFLPSAGYKSGSLITVDYAVKMGKIVYGTWGNIFDPMYAGINDYICKFKVKPIVDFDLFVKSIFSDNIKNTANIPFNNVFSDKSCEILYGLLSLHGKLDIGKLVEYSGIDMGTVLSSLMILEIDGLIYNHGNGLFFLKKNG